MTAGRTAFSGPGASDLLARVPRVWLVAGGGWAGRGIQVLCQLLAVRILTDSLGTAGYGVFAVLASLSGWLALADFSIGVSLQNTISERRALDQDSGDVVLTASLLACAACLLTLVMLMVLGPWLSGFLLSGFGTLSVLQRLVCFYAMVLPGVGTALGGIVYKVWFANHRGYLSSLVPAAGTIVGTLAVWCVARLGPDTALPWSVGVFYAPVAVLPIVALIRTMVALSRSHRLAPFVIAPLLHRALRFWMFGIFSALVLQIDFIVMARLLNARDIATYSIATRVFGLVFFVYNAVLAAVWPVFSESTSRGDWNGVFRAIRKYVLIGLPFVAGCGIIAGFAWPLLIRILAPTSTVTIPLAITVLLTIYFMVRIWTDTFGTVIQSMNDLSIMWVVLPLQAVLSIAFQTLGAVFLGLPGILIGLIACFTLTSAWVFPLRCRYHARVASGR